jgi:AraC-like DNA-binding protein
MKAVALAAGFSSVDLMRRAFVRILGITPRRYCEAIAAGKQASQVKSPVRGPLAAGSSLMR